jgi:hypothetical protein
VKDPLVAVSAALTLAAAAPAVAGLMRGTIRNLRVSSWGSWTAAQLVGGFSALAQHQYPAAVYVLFCAGECGLVAVLAWRTGDKRFSRLDAVCVALVTVGLVLLVVVRAPGPAVVLSVATDLAAYLPTIRHAWQSPREEPPWCYLLYGAGAAILLPVADWHVLTGVAYPLYLAVLDTAVAVTIWARRMPPVSPGRLVPPAGHPVLATRGGAVNEPGDY